MKIKEILKTLIGEENYQILRGNYNYVKTLPVRRPLITVSNDYEIASIARFKGKNVFCGYYDLSPDSPINNNEILVHVLDKNAKAGDEAISIYTYNLLTSKYRHVTDSKTWCWQMGARARWSYNSPGYVYVNDYMDGQYICKIVNVNDGSIYDIIPNPLYDISKNEQYGAFINFSRLERLRPGYGYCNIKDFTEGIIAPSTDGLFLYNMAAKASKLIVSYEALSEMLPHYSKGENYINHISFSPSGNQIMFFYIWISDEKPGWKATLFIYNIKSASLKCIEEIDQVSHYAWIDEKSLLITGISRENGSEFYRTYNTSTGKFNNIVDVNLVRDGHPVLSRSDDIFFYGDTYPDISNHQTFFSFGPEGYKKIANVYHDPRMHNEMRCDLHPHYFSSNETIALDSTFENNIRSVIILTSKDA